MAAGLQVNLNEVRNLSGALARATFSAMDNVGKFKAWLDGLSNQDLVDETFAADLAEANELKSGFTDLGDFNLIWRGEAPVYPIPRDLRVNPLKLLGDGMF
jgi:hypothetical protein